MTETIHLVEVTDSTGTVHRFCTGTGYTSLPTDTPPNTYYSPRVIQPGLFRQSMYSNGATSGKSSGGKGDIVLMNTDFGLDYMIDLGFDGQSCVVKSGAQGAPLSQFATVITGTVEQPEFPWNRVNLILRDKTILLAVPAQTEHYLGNNIAPDGREGGEELKDKPKPRLFGVCNNITPICINTSKLIYQVNNGAVYDITAVHDGGNVGQITKGADYATGALLEAATVPAVTNPPTAPAQYLTCLAEGLFRLDAAPFMQLTCDVIQGATAADRTAGQIIKTLAIEKLGSAFVASQPIIDLDKVAPYTVGIYTGDADVTTSELLDQLCQSVGAWWGFDNLGIFWAKQLTAPVSTQAALTLTQAEILSIERVATTDSDKGVPVWRVFIDFSKNWTVQTSGLAGSVEGNQLLFEPSDPSQLTVDRKNLLAMEYLRTKAEDAAIKSVHALATESIITTTLSARADADTEAARQLALRKVRRDRLRVSVPFRAIQFSDSGYWDDESITDLIRGASTHRAIVVGNYLYVVGGWVGSPEFYYAGCSRLDLLNPTGAWDDAGVTNLPVATFNMGLASDGSYLYVVGGNTNGGAVSKVYRLNLSNPSGAWDDAGITDLPTNLTTMGAVAYGGYLYVVGGLNGTPQVTVRRLNLAAPTGAWDDVGVTDLPIAKDQAYVTLHGSKLVVGGGRNASFTTTNSVHYLDLSNPAGAWQSLPNIVQADYQGTATSVGNYIYFIAGTNNATRVQRLDMTNPVVWETSTIAQLPQRGGAGSAVAYNNSIYMTGGTDVVNSIVINTPRTMRLRQNLIPEDFSQLYSLGRTVNVVLNRLGYVSGRAMQIIGSETDLKNRNITLDLWG